MPLERSPWEGERIGVPLRLRWTRSCGCGDGEEATEGEAEICLEL